METDMGLDRLHKQVEKERRDLQVLAAVLEHAPIGIVRLAAETDLPQHKVRYSLRMLEGDGLIEPTPQGAVPVDDVAAHVTAINEGIDTLVERLKHLERSFEESSDA